MAFVATYSTAYIATYIPIFGAIEIGGLDGPALCSSIITYVGLQNYIDIAWITENPYLSKDGVNALIAMELNGWGDFLRLPAVLHATPYVSKKLEGLRKQS